MIALPALVAGMAAMTAIWTPLRAQPRGRGGSGGREGKGAASALAVLAAAPGGPKVEGTVLFFARGGGEVQVVADVSGLDKPGLYALRVHAKGECAADPAGKQPFASAGGDFNPTGAAHACPDAAKHHAGDLGNIEVKADGTGHLELTTGALALSGASSVVDKAVILHAGSDDCTTQPDGNAGARLACGVAESVDTSPGRQPRRRGRTPPGSGSSTGLPGAR
ncbi:MAG TPA: superoxide dismutase family protein [Thermoanaerobaculia bacterium]